MPKWAWAKLKNTVYSASQACQIGHGSHPGYIFHNVYAIYIIYETFIRLCKYCKFLLTGNQSHTEYLVRHVLPVMYSHMNLYVRDVMKVMVKQVIWLADMDFFVSA